MKQRKRALQKETLSSDTKKKIKVLKINSLIHICSQQTTPKDKTEECRTVRNGGE